MIILYPSVYNIIAMPRLRQSLLNTVLVRLRAIASFWDIPLTASRQREVALELTEAMADPETVTRAYQKLTDDQRRAVDTVLASDSHVPQRVFAREWGEIRAMGPGRMERERPWEDPRSPAESLWYAGFLFQTFEQGPDGAYEAVFVPPEIRKNLPRPEADQPRVALEPVSTPGAITSAEDLLLDDACTLLAYVQNERPRPKSDRDWAKRHIEGLRSRLRDQDGERFLFLRHLASRTGWLLDGEGRPLRLDPEAVTAWLQSTSFKQRCTMTAAWRDDPTWNDLLHVPTLQPEDTGAWRNDPVLARQAILHHLKACGPSSWYEIAGFVAAMKDVDPDFQRPTGDYDSWYIRDRETGVYLSGFESWDAIEGRLIRYVLTRPLAWLGLVELGAAASDQAPYAFRLSQDGAAFLELVDPPSPSVPPSPRIETGFRVSIRSDCRYARFQLARVAQWERTGDRFIYRLTPGSLKRARQQGISITRVLEFLQEITEAPVPLPVREALNRWHARGTEAQLERAVLLRLSSDELMDEVISFPRLSALILERIGPRAARVRQRDWPQVVARLAEMGLLPEVPDPPE